MKSRALFLALFMSVLLPDYLIAGGWVTQKVESPHITGRPARNALRIDGNAVPHIGYGNDQLYYARRDDGQWYIEVVGEPYDYGLAGSTYTRSV